jgi:quercetin dioxygenase-like cupin family protein
VILVFGYSDCRKFHTIWNFLRRRYEWVIVLRGEAMLEFEEETRMMRPGDYVFIPAHCKHRVAGTSKEEPTVLLAVFFGNRKSLT